MFNNTKRGNKEEGNAPDKKSEGRQTSQAMVAGHKSKENNVVAFQTEVRNITSSSENSFCTYCKKNGHLHEM